MLIMMSDDYDILMLTYTLQNFGNLGYLAPLE